MRAALPSQSASHPLTLTLTPTLTLIGIPELESDPLRCRPGAVKRHCCQKRRGPLRWLAGCRGRLLNALHHADDAYWQDAAVFVGAAGSTDAALCLSYPGLGYIRGSKPQSKYMGAFGRHAYLVENAQYAWLYEARSGPLSCSCHG